jgi:predicted DNA-binding transcriptional regulator YafY
LDTVGELHLIFPERFNRGKGCPRPFKNVKEQTKALLNLLVRVKLADFREVRREILKHGASVEVLSPPELREEVKKEIEKMGEIYR